MTAYDDVMRTIIELSEEQVEALAAICAGEGISRAEAVRRAVDAWLAQRRPATMDAAFGLWRGRVDSSDGYLAALRDEWP